MKDDFGTTLARNFALAQKHVQKLSKELEIATTRIDKYKRENLKIRHENQRLKMDIQRRDSEVFTMSKTFALKNNELAAEKSLNHKLSQENKKLQSALEKQNSEAGKMVKTSATNSTEIESGKSLIEKLTQENKRLKMAIERPNSLRWCSSQFKASLMNIQGDKNRKEFNALRADIRKLDQENLKLRNALARTSSRVRPDFEIIDLSDESFDSKKRKIASEQDASLELREQKKKLRMGPKVPNPNQPHPRDNDISELKRSNRLPFIFKAPKRVFKPSF